MKTLSIFFFLVLISNLALSQVQFQGLSSNPILQSSQKQLHRNTHSTDTLKLPFIDDFSYDQSYPNSTLWLDDNIYINDNLGVNPPSVGVATFDILDHNGEMYDTADVASFKADFLTSAPINLSKISAADSLYLSFYYQPKGYGWDSPDEEDSLILEFRTSLKTWTSIWAVQGSGLKDFEQIMISITDTCWLKADFQFRFYNYASIGGRENQEDAINNDFWNLDYVVLDTSRTMTNLYHDDISFYSRNNSLFYDYYSVPWKHYKLSSMTIDSVDYKLNNLSEETKPYNHLTYLLYMNNTLRLDSFDNGGGNILTLTQKNHLFSQKDMSGSSSTNNIPAVLQDSTSLQVVRYYSLTDSLFAYNDTVKYQQDFYNYYAFDDGTAEAGLALIGYDAQFAYKIDALRSDTLRGLSMFFNRYKDYGTADESVFSLCVWDNDNGKPGRLLYKEDNIKPRYTKGVNMFTTYKFKEPIYTPTVFFVGWKNDTRKVYSLAYDFNNDNDHRVFYNISDSWNELLKGTPMIRPLMGDDFEYVSTKEILNPMTLSIYPNPTSNIVFIDVENYSEASVQVYNSTGKLLMHRQILGKESINLKPFGKGVYLIKVLINNQLQSKKIIVL